MRSFCPYRICPVGAHVDHQLGVTTGMALDCGITMDYTPSADGRISLISRQFATPVAFSLHPQAPQHDWADYLRGAVIALAQRHSLSVGLDGVIDGALPIGGLSSSAAVILAFLNALCRVNDLQLSPQELIQLTQHAENDTVGVACGSLDPSCEVLAKRHHLLCLDTLDNSYDCIPAPPDMPPFAIAVIFSGRERALGDTPFNRRVEECREAARTLLSTARVLRDVPRSVFDDVGRQRLSTMLYKRALHWFTEQQRVTDAVAAWRRGDLAAFGRLCFASGLSSFQNYETGSVELRAIYDILTETDGVYGARPAGSGFKGSAIALIRPDAEDAIREHVTTAFLHAFPHLQDRFAIHCCHSGNGTFSGQWSVDSVQQKSTIN